MKTVYDKTLLNRFTDQVLNLILFKKNEERKHPTKRNNNNKLAGFLLFFFGKRKTDGKLNTLRRLLVQKEQECSLPPKIYMVPPFNTSHTQLITFWG